MKYYYAVRLLTVLLLFLFFYSNAQVKTKLFFEGVPFKFVKHKDKARVIRLAAPTEFLQKKNDFKQGKQNDEKENRFAFSVPVNIDLLSEASQKPGNDTMRFSTTIIAENALNISVEFSKFELMASDVLSIFTNKELTDSITSNQNNENKVWATRVYQGDTLTFVLTSVLLANCISVK